MNKAYINEFVHTILIEGKFDKFQDYFDGDNYIQHNPNIADGLSGLFAGIEAMDKQGVKMEYYKLHKLMGEGNFVLTMCEGKFAGAPTTYYDLFRIENGKIAEHWDVMEPLLPEADWKNTNGKF